MPTAQRSPDTQLSATNNDIQVLTQQSTDLGGKIDRWNSGMVFALVLTVVAAIAVLVTTVVIVRLSRKLNEASSDLVSAKDRQLQLELGGKDLELQRLKIRADEAESKIASAQADAARAQKTTEQERLRRVQLEAKIAPRRLTSAQQVQIGSACSVMYGRTLHVQSYANDPEAAVLALQIADAFAGRGIRVGSSIGRIVQAGPPDEGVQVRGAAEDGQFTNCVAKALHDIGGLQVTLNGPRHETSSSVGDITMTAAKLLPAGPLPAGSEAVILVGVKPFERPEFAPMPYFQH